MIAAENPSVGDAPVLSAENPDSNIPQSSNDKTSFDGNPVQDITDTEQIKKEPGYSVKTPAYIPENYQVSDMCVIAGDLAQITYKSENDTLCYRIAKGDDDISGDYSSYINTETIHINNSDVTIQGNDNLYHKASWTDNGESFSLCSDSGIEKETMVDMI